MVRIRIRLLSMLLLSSTGDDRFHLSYSLGKNPVWFVVVLECWIGDWRRRGGRGELFFETIPEFQLKFAVEK